MNHTQKMKSAQSMVMHIKEKRDSVQQCPSDFKWKAWHSDSLSAFTANIKQVSSSLYFNLTNGVLNVLYGILFCWVFDASCNSETPEKPGVGSRIYPTRWTVGIVLI